MSQYGTVWLRKMLDSLGCPDHLLSGKADLTVPTGKMGGGRKQLRLGSLPAVPTTHPFFCFFLFFFFLLQSSITLTEFMVPNVSPPSIFPRWGKGCCQFFTDS